MTEIISITDIVQDPPKDYFMPSIGERTMAFINSQEKIDEDSKLTIIEEAQDILSHCILPGNQESITNIAVGYVQSGKTLSFTTLTALAADNNWRIVIYLTGTKTNLKEQTSSRLRQDLLFDENEYYKIFTDPSISDRNRIKNFMEIGQEVLLFPILKFLKIPKSKILLRILVSLLLMMKLTKQVSTRLQRRMQEKKTGKMMILVELIAQSYD